MDILEEIVAHKQQELERMRQKKVSMREALLASPTGIMMELPVLKASVLRFR